MMRPLPLRSLLLHRADAPPGAQQRPRLQVRSHHASWWWSTSPRRTRTASRSRVSRPPISPSPKTANRSRSRSSNTSGWKTRPLPPPGAGAARREAAAAASPVKAAPTPIAPAKAGEVKYKDRRLLVLFFDQAGMPVADQIRAQQAALKFVNSQITAVGHGGRHDLRHGPERPAGFHGRPRRAHQGDPEAWSHRRYRHGERQHRRRQRSRHRRRLHADDTEFNIFNTDRKLAALESAVKMLGSLRGEEGAGLLRQRHDAAPASTTRRNCAPPSMPRSAATLRSIRWTRAAWWPPRRWATPRRDRRAARACTPAVRSAPRRATSRGSRKRSTRWPPIPAARRCWTTTISRWASCRRRRISPVTTSSATTAPTPPSMAATAASRCRSAGT